MVFFLLCLKQQIEGVESMEGYKIKDAAGNV
jgi:hypothetical protein